MAGRCQPFQRLMRKDAIFGWDQSCQNAFDSIKKYLLNPPILNAPAARKPLLLYITTQETLLGALLAQENDKDKECALYYLSRTLTGAELNYSPIEKMCLALFFTIDKLRHYIMDPLIMFFDGAAQRRGAGVSIVFISPKKHMLPYSFTLGKEESTKALEEAHLGIFGTHESGPKLQRQLKRMGYYWPTMIHDSIHFAKYYEACQFHENFIHQPPEPLHPTIASWSFEA
ncbi:gypsy-like retrotransposase [Cucumis melo var. makuwa]|uniref:Gypsy-like retrotransposase n=1 Tax=Cucumis melo var. makuwa TaxID=1194695 RepID=A0A5D3BXP5_CUCMM|nr:gypsy-like retrotransposase [Cucumis melo var. makuwa]TYK03784.1 gypsy-like retrotransposase [Cucumis melo var. makuwa]